MSEIQEINRLGSITGDEMFESDVLKADILVLVSFMAEWSGPSNMVRSILQELASTYEGKVKFYEVNIDETPGIAPNYGIRGVTTLLLFKEGEVAGTKVGALSKGQLQEFLMANLG